MIFSYAPLFWALTLLNYIQYLKGNVHLIMAKISWFWFYMYKFVYLQWEPVNRLPITTPSPIPPLPINQEVTDDLQGLHWCRWYKIVITWLSTCICLHTSLQSQNAELLYLFSVYIKTINHLNIPGRIAQSVMCLAIQMCVLLQIQGLRVDPGTVPYFRGDWSWNMI